MKIKGSSESSFLGFQGRLFLAATLLLLYAMLNTALAEEPRKVDSAIRDLPKPVATTIYVSDYPDDLVEVFPLSGGTGTPFATIDAPTGLAFDMVGNLYVSSLKPSGMISKVTPSGEVSRFSDDSDLGHPHGLAFDAAGSLFVVTAGGHTVVKFKPNGAAHKIFASGLSKPFSVIFDSLGNLFVSDGFGGPSGTGSVLKYRPNGRMTVFADTGFSTPYGLAFDSHWNLYVSNQSANTIERFAYDGSGRTTFVGDNGILSSPLGMVIDSFDNLYVANRDTDTIEEFSPTGAHVTTFHTGANPHFLALK